AEEIGSQRDIAVAYANLGWAYSQSGDLVEGDDFNLQALERWRYLGDRRGEFHTLFNLGLRYETNDDPTTALDYYLQAIGVLESIIGDLNVDDYQSAFTDQFTEVYQRAVRLQSEKGLFEEGFDLSERARSRAFLDSFSGQQPVLSDQTDADLLADERLLQAEISQLEDRLSEARALLPEQRDLAFADELESELISKQKTYQDLLAQIALSNPRMISLVSTSTITTAEIQAALDNQTTLISYFLTDRTSLAFVFTDESLDLVELPLSPQEIGAAVESFRDLGLANPGGPVPNSLKTLYEGLIEPLEGFLSRPVVAFVPHQSLHYVPFAALHDGDQYLGEQFIIYYLPSVSTKPFVDQTTGRSLKNPIVLGDPETPNSNLPALGYAAQEALQVAELFSTEALLGVDATENSITNRLGDSGLLHMAAHGSYNQAAPQFSRIWLAADEKQDGRLNVYEVYNLDLQSVDLVTLSACQSNLGDLSSGDELVGLSRAFLYGSSSVVASLWSVDDQSTGAMMTSFYSYLVEGRGKAEALQAAQKDVRENPDHPEWAHPYYWAAFVLNGDPGDFQSDISGGFGQSSGDQGKVFGLPTWLIYTLGLVLVVGGGFVTIRIVSARVRRIKDQTKLQ
ncbi:MAG: CHAT domain-containing protein, partial [Anaerolineales bacterium]|nr:CHAT domain-containing protein [Anaerolineales bacterium]